MKITIIKGGLRSKVGIYKWSKEEQKKKLLNTQIKLILKQNNMCTRMNYKVNEELGDAYNTIFFSAELSKKEAS